MKRVVSGTRKREPNDKND